MGRGWGGGRKGGGGKGNVKAKGVLAECCTVYVENEG